MGELGGEAGEGVEQGEVAAEGAALPVEGFGDGGLEGRAAGFGVVGGDETLDDREVFVGNVGHGIGRRMWRECVGGCGLVMVSGDNEDGKC